MRCDPGHGGRDLQTVAHEITRPHPLTLLLRSATSTRPRPPSQRDPRVGSVHEVTAVRTEPVLRRRREIVAVIDPTWLGPGGDVTASVRAPQADVVEAAARGSSRHLHPGEVVAATQDGRLTFRLRHDDHAARPVRLQEMAYHCIEALDAVGAPADTTDLGIGWARITAQGRCGAGRAPGASRRRRVRASARPPAPAPRRHTSSVSRPDHLALSRSAGLPRHGRQRAAAVPRPRRALHDRSRSVSRPLLGHRRVARRHGPHDLG